MGYLFDLSLRSLAVAALAELCLCSVKSAAVKHAVWTMVTAGMLLQILLSPLLPPLPLPVLRPVELVADPILVTSAPMPASVPRPQRFPIIPAIYIAGVLLFAARLLRAFVFTRRLVRRAEPIGLRLFQSREIAVPVTAGAKILLPLAWPDWQAGKLRAVLAHETAHVRRRDSIVALLARVNRCVFWFHPLAWWLERELAQLAEQACDDAALAATQDRQQYARTLLDMARAVHTSQGRFMTAAMAKETKVETRINRILDESRRIPKALGKASWTILVACAAPLIYFAAAVQLAPAQTPAHTLTQIPAPAAPQPPQLIAQAAPAPAPPAPVAAPPAQQEPQAVSQDPPPRPRDNGFGGQLGVGGPVYIPKIYNGHNKSFFFFNYQDGQASQAPYSYSDQLKVSVDLSVQGSANIGIPFPEADGKYDIIAEVRDQTGRAVLNNRLTGVTGAKWSVQVALTPGAYVLKVLVRNNTSGRLSTNQTNFEVK